MDYLNCLAALPISPAPTTRCGKARARLPSEGLWRTVCDYIAGMTDRYAMGEIIKYGLDKS